MIGAVQSHHHQHHHHGHGGRAEKVARDTGAQLSAGAYREEQAASFVFVTADGDKVTLTANATRAIEYATYGADGMLAAGARASSASAASLSVEGELDAEELRDIGKALTLLRRAARDGDLDEREVAALSARRDLDSLQSVAGSIEITRTAIAVDAAVAADQAA